MQTLKCFLFEFIKCVIKEIGDLFGIQLSSDCDLQTVFYSGGKYIFSSAALEYLHVLFLSTSIPLHFKVNIVIVNIFNALQSFDKLLWIIRYKNHIIHNINVKPI